MKFLLFFISSGIIADQHLHRYATRHNQQRAMDQMQAELTELRTRMNQFMDIMQGVAQSQQELRALVQRPEVPNPNVGNTVDPPGGDHIPTGGVIGGTPGGNPGGPTPTLFLFWRTARRINLLF